MASREDRSAHRPPLAEHRFETATEHSGIGRFRTLPAPGPRRPLRIGFFGCQSYTEGYWAAHRGLAEFVVPSVSSDNNTEYLGGAGQLAQPLARSNNPHFEMVDWIRHGYCVLELDRHEARIDYRHVASKLDPESPTSTTYRFRAPRGEIRLEAR